MFRVSRIEVRLTPIAMPKWKMVAGNFGEGINDGLAAVERLVSQRWDADLRRWKD